MVLVLGEMVVQRDLEVALLQAIGSGTPRSISGGSDEESHRKKGPRVARGLPTDARIVVAMQASARRLVAMRRLGKLRRSQPMQDTADMAFPADESDALQAAGARGRSKKEKTLEHTL